MSFSFSLLSGLSFVQSDNKASRAIPVYNMLFLLLSGLPFIQLNNRKGKLSFKGGKSPNTKELGELGPECIAHGVMEKEYAVIRKVCDRI